MIVELHILQHFAPSNLNRDDTGAPKDCIFGGVRRARISSQCIKRAIRMYVQQAGLLAPELVGIRTKRIIGELADRLKEKGRDPEAARLVVQRLLQGAGLHPKADDPDKTEYLLFVGRDQIGKLADIAQEHWDTLAAVTEPAAEAEAQTGRPSRRDQKKAAKAAIPPSVTKEVKSVLSEATRAVDVALFGRMIADMPEGRVDAASQVAHAISTHHTPVEMDYFTAVDDLLPQETTGADMIGTVEFNSACYYRYANVSIDQLVNNLGGDAELARRGLEAFLKAAILAVPTGKQNSFAAHNPPAFVASVVRERGAWSLVNAFVQPVRPSERHDLVQASIAALDRYWGKLTDMYGAEDIDGLWVATHEPEELQKLPGPKGLLVSGTKELVERTVSAAFSAR